MNTEDIKALKLHTWNYLVNKKNVFKVATFHMTALKATLYTFSIFLLIDWHYFHNNHHYLLCVLPFKWTNCRHLQIHLHLHLQIHFTMSVPVWLYDHWTELNTFNLNVRQAWLVTGRLLVSYPDRQDKCRWGKWKNACPSFIATGAPHEEGSRDAHQQCTGQSPAVTACNIVSLNRILLRKRAVLSGSRDWTTKPAN